MDEQTRQFARRRAGDRCEYCHLPQHGHEERFPVDHVRPSKHARDDLVANLAFSCLRCNLFKESNLSGIDPTDRRIVELFDPRRQLWNEHFRWEGARVAGVTPVGRATVSVMAMNAPERIALRHSLIQEGRLSSER